MDALTASVLQEDDECALNAGMEDFVDKPIRVAELEAALCNWAAAPDTRKAA